MTHCILALFLVLAPVPKEKPIEQNEFIGKWKLKCGDQSGTIEFHADGVYVATLEETLVYSGKWYFKDGILIATGRVYTLDGRDISHGGFCGKIDKRFSGITYDNYRFKLEKP